MTETVYEPLDLDAQRKRVEDRAQLSEFEMEQAKADLRRVMGSESGRRFINRLLSRCGVYRSSFTGNSETFFREGARNVGLFLLAEIQAHCAEEFLTMLKEQTND